MHLVGLQRIPAENQRHRAVRQPTIQDRTLLNTRDIEQHAWDPQVLVLETYAVLSLQGDWGLKLVSTLYLSPQDQDTFQQRALVDPQYLWNADPKSRQGTRRIGFPDAYASMA